jgi:hypothetical protein
MQGTTHRPRAAGAGERRGGRRRAFDSRAPFLGALEAGQAPRSALEALAAEQHLVIPSDRRSFAQLAARFPEDPAGAFFLSMAEGEGLALGQL